MNQINQPDICVKSAAFEGFIKKRLFPTNKYELMSDNHVSDDEPNEYPELISQSFYQFKSRESGREFYVVARYLTGVSRPSIEWCKDTEFQEYQLMDNTLPVYIIIGFGFHPAAPRQLVMFPLKNMRFNKVLLFNLEKYKISTTHSVEEEDLK
jgi:hypothetical protein